MQKPDEKKESKSNKCYSKRNAKMITINKGFRILFPPLFKRNCYWLYWTAFNTCLAVLVCKAENMNVVKSFPPLVLISDWIDQTIWFLVGWRASSIDPLPRVDALAQPFKQRWDKTTGFRSNISRLFNHLTWDVWFLVVFLHHILLPLLHEGGRKKGVTHGPGYAGNGGIMRVSRPGWPPLVIPPLTNSFFFILKVIYPSRSFIDLSFAGESEGFPFFNLQDLTAVRILVGSHGLGGRCESSLFCLSKLWLNLVTTLNTFFEYIQFPDLLQWQHICDE